MLSAYLKEALSGWNSITGESLTDTERGSKMLEGIVSLIPVGAAIKTVGKGGKVLLKTIAKLYVSESVTGLSMYGANYAGKKAGLPPELQAVLSFTAGATVAKISSDALFKPGGLGIIDDVAKGASGAKNSVDDIISGVEKGDIKLTNNMQKGNYGEMKMDSYFEQQGYKRVSLDKVTDINAPTHQGIDGVYYNPNGKPPYVIGEAKYGSSTLGKTKDGLQMSDTWIKGSDRLVKAVGKDLADDIFLEGFGKSVVHIKPDGTIIPKVLK